jgi:hypothetical protein
VGGWGNVAEVEFYGYTPVSTAQVVLASVFAGNEIEFAWPVDHIGWHLQVQTNSLGPDWITIPGSDSTNGISLPIDPSNGSVFFRLIYP